MNESLEMLSQALFLGVLISAIPLSVSFVIGLITAILQALTQVQEQTISFFPKIVGLVITLFFFGSWIISKIANLMVIVIDQVSRS